MHNKAVAVHNMSSFSCTIHLIEKYVIVSVHQLPEMVCQPAIPVIHIASCSRKYVNNEDGHGINEHNPLKSSYDSQRLSNVTNDDANDCSDHLF